MALFEACDFLGQGYYTPVYFGSGKGMMDERAAEYYEWSDENEADFPCWLKWERLVIDELKLENESIFWMDEVQRGG